MKKYIILCLAGLLCMFLPGCVANTYNLTEMQQKEAIKKYPRTGLNLQLDDSVGMITAKVITRTILWPITIGISEGVLLEEREKSFSKYVVDLYYNSFLNKKKVDVILEFGAPSRSCSDGNNGEICIYERTYMTGGEGYYIGNHYHSTPYRTHKDIKEFYFSQEGVCYRWKLKSE